MSQTPGIARAAPQRAPDSDALAATAELTPNLPAGLIKGLRNYWYPVLQSEELEPGKAVGFTVLAESLVAWRDRDGNEFGIENLGATLRTCTDATAAGAVRSLQDAVLGFSPRPLRDDATLLLVDTH